MGRVHQAILNIALTQGMEPPAKGCVEDRINLVSVKIPLEDKK